MNRPTGQRQSRRLAAHETPAFIRAVVDSINRSTNVPLTATLEHRPDGTMTVTFTPAG